MDQLAVFPEMYKVFSDLPRFVSVLIDMDYFKYES